MEWYREKLPNLETMIVEAGLHYIQEDQPEKTGQTIAQWMTGRGL
ncbi:hypothetical protein [Marinobacter sp.]